MTTQNALGQYLRARREQTHPQDVGVIVTSSRRVAGLRRDEVALLAGISTEYYTRLEQGRDYRPSVQVLDALARVLQLDPPAAAHLRGLVTPTGARRRRPPVHSERVRPSLAQMLDGMTNPAWIEGRYLDVLYANRIAQALTPRLTPGVNLLRYTLDDQSPEFQAVGAEIVIGSLAARLRATAGTDFDDPRLQELVGELTLKSELFRETWAAHGVETPPASGRYPVEHPELGEFELTFEKFQILGSPDQTLVISHAEPNSRSAQALILLAMMLTGTPAGQPADTDN